MFFFKRFGSLECDLSGLYTVCAAEALCIFSYAFNCLQMCLHVTVVHTQSRQNMSIVNDGSSCTLSLCDAVSLMNVPQQDETLSLRAVDLYISHLNSPLLKIRMQTDSIFHTKMDIRTDILFIVMLSLIVLLAGNELLNCGSCLGN